MKLVTAVLLGVLATFGLTIVGEFFVMNVLAKGVRLPFAEMVVGCPLIALVVGSLIGLVAKEKALVAAALAIAPWAIFLVLGAGRGRTAFSWWVIMLAAATIYLGLGIAAAALVGGRMVRSAALNSR
jgi:hypothetical protein